MPNRIIKESICSSETLDQLTAEEERLFYRLLVQADDFGRFDGRAQIILAACFPLRVHEITVEQVETWLQRLADVGLIRFYHVDGRRYLYFATRDKHQQKRAKRSKWPEPPAADERVSSFDINCNQTIAYAPEKRESRNEKRETRQTDHARACAHVQTDASELVGDPSQSVSPSVDSVGDACDDELAAVFGTPAWHTVTDAYHQRIGIMGSTQAQQLATWIRRGMAAEVLIAAIDEAAATAERERNPRKRRWSYIDGILRNWYNDGIRTADDLRARGRADPRSPDYDPVAVILERAEEWERQYKEVAGGDS